MNLTQRTSFILATVLLLLIPTTPARAIFDTIIDSVASFFAIVGLEFLKGGQILLNETIQYLLVDFSQFIVGDGLGDIVKITWQLFRDTANIFITFAFVFIAFSAIFGSFGQKRTMLIYLVIASIITNFSAFFILAIVDISNAISLALLSVVDDVLGEKFIGVFVESTLVFANPADPLLALVFSIGVFLALLLVSVVFFTTVIILALRFVNALLLIITAPIGVLLWAVNFANGVPPSLKKHYETWVALLKKVFLTPIFIFFGLIFSTGIFFGIFNSALESNTLTPVDDGGYLLLADLVIASILFFIINIAIAVYVTKMGDSATSSKPSGKSGEKGDKDNTKNNKKSVDKDTKNTGGKEVTRTSRLRTGAAKFLKNISLPGKSPIKLADPNKQFELETNNEIKKRGLDPNKPSRARPFDPNRDYWVGRQRGKGTGGENTPKK